MMGIGMPELRYRSKEILSWMVVAELLKRMDEDLFVCVLHPGGGQYDTLSLSSFEEVPVFLLNRNGITANVKGQLIEDIWSRAAVDPVECALHILSEADVEVLDGELSEERIKLIRFCGAVGVYLNENYQLKPKVEWGWIDSSYSVGPNSNLDDFKIPETWMSLAGPTKNIGWQGWIYVLSENGENKALLNINNGECVDREGNNWNGLNQDLKALGDDLKIPFGYKFYINWPSGREMTLDFVHPSMVRGTLKIYSEEGCDVKYEPVYRISDRSVAEDTWAMVDDAASYRAKLKDYLD